MSREQAIKLLSSPFIGVLSCIIFFLFVALVVYYDAIEMPNIIGYFTLGLALISSLFYYLITKHNFGKIMGFGFVVWLILLIPAHTINFLIAFDYRGQFVIENKRPIASYREEWKVRLNDNRRITLIVSDDYTGDGADVNLRKGIFGVYFGNWPE